MTVPCKANKHVLFLEWDVLSVRGGTLTPGLALRVNPEAEMYRLCQL